MRKLFLSAIILCFFSLSILLFQVSCQKSADAQQGSNYVLPIATPTTLGGVKPDGTTILVDATGKISTAQGSSTQNDIILYTKFIPGSPVAVEYWICNRDGSNKKKVMIPSSLTLQDHEMSLLSDKNSVVFPAKSGTGTSDIYTMNIDGTNLKKIVGDGVNDYYNPVAYF